MSQTRLESRRVTARGSAIPEACVIPNLYSSTHISTATTYLSIPFSIHFKMVLLVTSDNEQFNADKDVVERSVLIKNMLEGKSHLVCNINTAVFIFTPFFT